MMRNKKIIVCICTIFMLTGCSNAKADSNVSAIDRNGINTEENQSIANVDNSQEDDVQSQPDNSIANVDNPQEGDVQSQPDNSPSQSDSGLDGNVESIGTNSVVINKLFHPSENVVVLAADDSEKVLITVYFSEETEFEVWTTKNGGVNGDADTEKRQGAFSDLTQDVLIRMTGSYDGDDFYAKHVIICKFV